jgi:hypothetical protein
VLSGEANQRLSFVLPELAEAFPAAHVIWLVRDGRPTVVSLHRRAWYRELRPTQRIEADQVGEMSAASWAGLDPFARCCWYWSFTNRLIERELARLPLRALRLRIEDLSTELPAVWAFLELPGPVPAPARRANRVASGRRTGWRLWSPRQRRTFTQLCGDPMDRLYPDWRSAMRWTLAEELQSLVGRQRAALGAVTRPLRERVGLAAPRRRRS